eukprot:7331-Pleurochrysis_carterae.AAC.1
MAFLQSCSSTSCAGNKLPTLTEDYLRQKKGCASNEGDVKSDQLRALFRHSAADAMSQPRCSATGWRQQQSAPTTARSPPTDTRTQSNSIQALKLTS